MRKVSACTVLHSRKFFDDFRDNIIVPQIMFIMYEVLHARAYSNIPDILAQTVDWTTLYSIQ